MAVALAEVRPLTLAQDRRLPVAPELEDLLPRGLARGSVVSVTGSGGATALAMTLLAEASRTGAWAAAVGLPDLGLVAAAEQGIVLERLALVPDPGEEWANVLAALLDGVELVLTRPPRRLGLGTARRLATRARERGAVVVATGTPWPERADVRLVVAPGCVSGVGDGHGHLVSRAMEVTATGRGAAARERRVEIGA